MIIMPRSLISAVVRSTTSCIGRRKSLVPLLSVSYSIASVSAAALVRTLAGSFFSLWCGLYTFGATCIKGEPRPYTGKESYSTVQWFQDVHPRVFERSHSDRHKGWPVPRTRYILRLLWNSRCHVADYRILDDGSDVQ